MNHIVLYEPEIPENTGNIIRTCVAMGMRLHIVEPAGFPLSMERLKRSAVNYIDEIDVEIHDDFEAFANKHQGRYYFLTRYGSVSPDQADFQKGEEDLYLIFGSESSGIPKALLQKHEGYCLRIPMRETMRSLNLANSVAVLAYEVTRQQNYEGLFTHEPDSKKGKDYLKR